jgi:hypothetical protein
MSFWAWIGYLSIRPLYPVLEDRVFAGTFR